MSRRILLITDIFPPDVGGPASFIPDLAEALAGAGYEVTVFCQSNERHHADDAARPYRVQRTLRRSGYFSAARVHALLLREVARHEQVFCNGLERYTHRVCELLKRQYTLKVVGDSAWEGARNHGLTHLDIDTFQSTPPDNNVTRLVAQRLSFVRAACRIITPSNYLNRLVQGWGCPPERVFTVLNGVHLHHYDRYQPQARIPGTPLRLVYAGRLVNWKGVDTVLRALDSVENVMLDIVGSGPEMESLRNLAASLRVTVRLLGQQARAAALDLMAQAHALVLMSSYEGLSHTLIEACACGVPCITSTSGGNPEVIQPEENGLLVRYDDVAGLKAAILRLRDDESLRFRLAEGAKRRSHRFDFSDTLAGTIRVFLDS